MTEDVFQDSLVIIQLLSHGGVVVEMTVAGLALDASTRSPIILLRDPSGRRQVPIWIDHAQAHNILAGIKHSDKQSHLSHDLMMTLLEAGNLQLDRIIIHSIAEKKFQALLRLHNEALEENVLANEAECSFIEVESRPSDAIALAVRAGCGIWMLEEVVAEASIPVDAEADEEDQYEFRQFLEELSPAAFIRHLKTRNPINEDSSGMPGDEDQQ